VPIWQKTAPCAAAIKVGRFIHDVTICSLLWSRLLLAVNLRGLGDVAAATPIIFNCITKAAIVLRGKVACVVEDDVCSVINDEFSGLLLQHLNSLAQMSSALLNFCKADPQAKPGGLIFDAA